MSSPHPPALEMFSISFLYFTKTVKTSRLLKKKLYMILYIRSVGSTVIFLVLSIQIVAALFSSLGFTLMFEWMLERKSVGRENEIENTWTTAKKLNLYPVSSGLNAEKIHAEKVPKKVSEFLVTFPLSNKVVWARV